MERTRRLGERPVAVHEMTYHMPLSPLRFLAILPTLTLLAACLLLAGCYASNFYEVDRGKFYRSAQLPADVLRRVVTKNDIKTVINLRGANLDKDWYRAEVIACEELGVGHYDLRMSARRIPHRDEVTRLLELFESVERPILIHCYGGSDRSGLASALYAIEYMGRSKKRARKQLSSRFFHFRDVSPSQRYFLHIYEGPEWVKDEYQPCEGYLYYDDEACRCGEPPGDLSAPFSQ